MNSDTLLTLDDLCAKVALALAADYDGVASDRVRDLPDRRTVRYYTTLGLLDRPTIQGRTAFYGRRHLLQLVAVKRLQANGLSLSAIQSRLIGLADTELAKLARLPDDAEMPAEEPKKAAHRDGFWKQSPAEPEPPDAETSEKMLQAVRLSDEVLLLLPLARTPDEFDLQSLRTAARPLLKLLVNRKLLSN